MGIISIIIVLFIVKKLIALILSIIGSILTVCSGSNRGRTQRIKQTKPERIRSERAANTELERIKLEREKQKLQYEKERLAIMQENAKYTRWKRLQQYKTQRNGSDQNGQHGQKKQIAEIDLAYCDQSLSDLTVMIDRLREEYENSLNDKTREKAYKKLSTLESRQNTLDKKRQIALNIINGV